jgi:hypothetical protein
LDFAAMNHEYNPLTALLSAQEALIDLHLIYIFNPHSPPKCRPLQQSVSYELDYIDYCGVV